MSAAPPIFEGLHRDVQAAAARGLYCAQIVMEVGLRRLGLSAPDAVAAMGGLIGVMGFRGVTCGALTAGGCLLALAGRSRLGDRVYMLIEDFEARWGELTVRYPGSRCADILDAEPDRLPTDVCPPLIAGAISLALKLLAGEGNSTGKSRR
jgi:hypothetical protein